MMELIKDLAEAMATGGPYAMLVVFGWVFKWYYGEQEKEKGKIRDSYKDVITDKENIIKDKDKELQAQNDRIVKIYEDVIAKGTERTEQMVTAVNNMDHTIEANTGVITEAIPILKDCRDGGR